MTKIRFFDVSGSTTDKNGARMAIDPAVSIYIELNQTASDFLLFKKNLFEWRSINFGNETENPLSVAEFFLIRDTYREEDAN